VIGGVMDSGRPSRPSRFYHVGSDFGASAFPSIPRETRPRSGDLTLKAKSGRAEDSSWQSEPGRVSLLQLATIPCLPYTSHTWISTDGKPAEENGSDAGIT
jgi:hypothetical protein